MRLWYGRLPRRLLPALLFAVLAVCGLVPVVSGRATDLEAYRRAARTLADHQDPWVGGEPRYLYPPLLATLFVPLRALPDRPVAAAWCLVSALGVAVAAARLGKRALLLAFVFAPLYATQWNAQANGLVLLALVLARERLDVHDEDGGGSWLGLSLAIKPLGLPAMLGLALTNRIRPFVLAAGVFALSFLVVIPFLGWRAVPLAFDHVAKILSSTWPDDWPANVSLSGTLDRLFREGAGSTRHLLVAAAVFAVTSVAAVVRRKRTRASEVLDLFLAATLLAAGASWLHHATVLLPLAAALPGAGVAAALLFAVAAAWRAAALAWPAHGALLASACGTAALALLWGAAMRRLWNER